MLIVFLVSCAGLYQAKLNKDFKNEDLPAEFNSQFNEYANALYKMPKVYTDPYVISIYRMNSLNVENYKIPAKLTLELLSSVNSENINCDNIKSKLTSNEVMDYENNFPFGMCQQEPLDAILSKYNELNDSIAYTPQKVDAHWAWFSATGDMKIIDKLVKSAGVVGVPCCLRCLEWSIPSMAYHNDDIYNYLVEYNEKLPEQSRSWFKRFIPEK
ncbi:MAG: hypothetical protein OCD01_04240 [Fibrobacterales bacterium]